MRASSSPRRAPSSAARTSSASSTARPPTYTRLPSMSGWKRAPSSSVKNATLIGRRVAMPCCASVSITSRPASTPRLPSKRPPGAHGVDVRADHHRRRRSGRCRARVATTLPIASMVTLQAEVVHPRHHQVAAVAIGVGERQPGAPAFAVRTVHGADLAERLEPSPQPSTIDPQVVPVHVGGSHVSDRSRTSRSRGALRRTPHGAVEQLAAPRSAVAAVGSPM